MPNMFSSILSLVIYHLVIFYALIEKGFLSFSRNTIDSLCDPYHDVTTIPFLSSSLNLKKLDLK